MPTNFKERMNNVSMLLRARELESLRDWGIRVESGFLSNKQEREILLLFIKSLQELTP